MMCADNLFQLPTPPSGEELATLLTGNETVRIERIVSTGQTTDWYDQEEWEFVSVLRGDAELAWEDGGITHLSSGDFLTIPAHRRHRVCYTSKEPPCVWLCVFWRQAQSYKTQETP